MESRILSCEPLPAQRGARQAKPSDQIDVTSQSDHVLAAARRYGSGTPRSSTDLLGEVVVDFGVSWDC